VQALSLRARWPPKLAPAVDAIAAALALTCTDPDEACDGRMRDRRRAVAQWFRPLHSIRTGRPPVTRPGGVFRGAPPSLTKPWS
jgi:hypothetical protein